MSTNAKIKTYPVGIYLLKVNNENSRTSCVICSKLAKKIPERPDWHEDIVQLCKLYNNQYVIASAQITILKLSHS